MHGFSSMHRHLLRSSTENYLLRLQKWPQFVLNHTRNEEKSESSTSASLYLDQFISKVFTVTWNNTDDFGIGITISLLLILTLALTIYFCFVLYRFAKSFKAERARLKMEVDRAVFNMVYIREY